MEKLYERIEAMLSGNRRLFYTLRRDELMDRSLYRVFERLAALDYRGNPATHPAMEDPGPAIALERLVKDRTEIRALVLCGYLLTSLEVDSLLGS